MEHTRTTPEQSVILKKIGYDVPDTHYWNAHLNFGWIKEEGDECNYNKDYTWYYTRPKLVDVATWLREVKGFHLTIDPTLDWCNWFIYIHDLSEKQWTRGYGSFNTHDLALSAGVDFILKKLDTHA